MIDFLGEIGSGPRFVYMAFPWIFSKSYRQEIRLEYRNRNKAMAWVEFSLAALSLVFWIFLIVGVVVIGIKQI